MFLLENSKTARTTPGCGQGTKGKLPKWLAEGGGGGGGGKALTCTCDAHQGPVRIQPLLRLQEREIAPGETYNEPSLLAVLLSLCSCPGDQLPMPCLCPACRIRPSAPSPRDTMTISPFRSAIPHPPVPHPSTARSLISPTHYPKSIKIYF